MSEVTAPTAPTFASLGLDERLVAPLAAREYIHPTPIQAEAIPVLLQGKDLIGLAGTGTGKTAAFALPLLHIMAAAGENRPRPCALILVPTRELCIQVATAVSKYGKALNVRVVPVYGGAGFSEQARAVRRGADVVVATPGRALDHIRRGTLDLKPVQAVVLDEADEMLDMGFAEDLDAILSETSAKRQTMLFSATMPPRIETIAQKHLKNPVRVQVAKPVAAPGEIPKVKQILYMVPAEHKLTALARVLEFEAPAAAIIFCRTRHEAETVCDALTHRGFRPLALHGGLSQEQRDRVMGKFRGGETTLVVATDVAARGLDIGHLSHVVNFGVPQMAETYVHRIGRVGRAGREGVSLTIAEPRERGALRGLERAAGRKPDNGVVPTAAALKARRRDLLKDGVKALLGTPESEPFHAAAAELIGGATPQLAVAAALAFAAKFGPPSDDGPDVPPLAAPRMAPPRPGFDRGPGGPPRGPGGPPESRGRRPHAGMDRVYISVGREAGFGRREIIAMLGVEVGLGQHDLGPIDVAERFSLVDVPAVAAEEVIDRLNGVRVRGRKLMARRDRAI